MNVVKFAHISKTGLDLNQLVSGQCYTAMTCKLRAGKSAPPIDSAQCCHPARLPKGASSEEGKPMRSMILGGAVMIALNVSIPETALEAPRLIAVDPVESGHRLAMNLCSTCHDVSPDQEFPPALINPAPGFATIANRPGTSGESLRKFLATTHGDMASLPIKMPDLMLTDTQKEVAIAYILSLRTDR
jgi:cytochrome c